MGLWVLESQDIASWVLESQVMEAWVPRSQAMEAWVLESQEVEAMMIMTCAVLSNLSEEVCAIISLKMNHQYFNRANGWTL